MLPTRSEVAVPYHITTKYSAKAKGHAALNLLNSAYLRHGQFPFSPSSWWWSLGCDFTWFFYQSLQKENKINKLCPDSNEVHGVQPNPWTYPVSSDSHLNTVEIVNADLNKICILPIICNWLISSQELGPCRTNTSSSNNFDIIRFISGVTVQIFAMEVKCWLKQDWTIYFQRTCGSNLKVWSVWISSLPVYGSTTALPVCPHK